MSDNTRRSSRTSVGVRLARRIVILVILFAVAATCGMQTTGEAPVNGPQIAVERLSGVAGTSGTVTTDTASSEAPRPLYRVDYGTVTDAVWVSLTDVYGFRGAVNDSGEALYLPIGIVLDIPGGTVTVTYSGLGYCADGVDRECSGAEFLTHDYVGEYALPSV